MQPKTTVERVASKVLKLVNNRLLRRWADLIRRARVPRDKFAQFMKNKERLKDLFFEIMYGDKERYEALKKSAKEAGARIHIMSLIVDYTESFEKAAKIAKVIPNNDVLKAWEKFSFWREGETIEEKVVVLLNWPEKDERGGIEGACILARRNNLYESVPHEVFAIVKQNPNLAKELEQENFLNLIATHCLDYEGFIKVCRVTWRDSKYYSYLNQRLDYQSCYDNGKDWFAFIKSK